MRLVAIALWILPVLTLSGCVALHAHVPDDVVRHAARADGLDVGASCPHAGHVDAEGALECMVGERMTCDETGRWVPTGESC